MSSADNSRSIFSYETLVHAVSGAAGSVVTMAMFFPLDTVRSRLQRLDEFIEYERQTGSPRLFVKIKKFLKSCKYERIESITGSTVALDYVPLEEQRQSKNTLSMIRELASKEGPSTLYRGMIPVLQSVCASNFVYFYTFHGLKMLKSRQNQTAGNDLLIASIAGVVNVLATSPLWVVNTRLKMKGLNKVHEKDNDDYNTLCGGLMHIWNKEGIKKLWSGTLASLMLVINPAIQFMTYESIKRRLSLSFRNSQLPAWYFFIIGAVAKTIATVLTYPLQLVQTKLRHGHKYPNLSSNASTMRILFYILKKHGVAGLYKGMEAKLFQTILTSAFFFFMYEKISRFVFHILLHKPILRKQAI